MAARTRTSKLITIGGPVGLALGIILGTMAHNGTAPWIADLLPYIDPIGRIWMNALRVAVVPLTVCLLVVGVCSLPKGSTLGAWGARTIGWFVGLLVAGAVFSVAATQSYFAFNKPAKVELPPLSSPIAVNEVSENWVDDILPSNAIAAAAAGDVLPLAVIAVLFGLALRALGEERRKPVEAVFIGVRDAVLVFVNWVILAIPIGAFALTFSFAVESGLETAGALAHFTVYVCVLMLIVLAALVLATIIVSRRGTSAIIAAISPLIAVAVGTRSSLASLPSLVQSAGQIELPDPATEIVLPTAVSIFKINRTISSTVKILFMASIVGVVVSPQALIVFIATVILLSFATPGIPAGGSNSTMGAYIAAGVPIEAVVLFEVTEGITDIVKTPLNVVADFAVAVFVSRSFAPSRTRTSSTLSAVSEEPAG